MSVLLNDRIIISALTSDAIGVAGQYHALTGHTSVQQCTKPTAELSIVRKPSNNGARIFKLHLQFVFGYLLRFHIILIMNKFRKQRLCFGVALHLEL